MSAEHRRRDELRRLAEYASIVIVTVVVSAIAIGLFGTQLGDVLSVISDRIHQQ